MLRLSFGMFKTKLKSQKYGSAWGRLRPSSNQKFNIEVWLSLVERYVRDVEVASSNLVTSTIKQKRMQTHPFLFL